MLSKTSSKEQTVIVNSEMVLIGSCRGLEQAYELLRAARVLHQAGMFPSAYGLAVFSREETGKLLERYWRASAEGEPITTDDINRGDLRSHASKLKAAGRPLNDGAMSLGLPPQPGSEEARELSHALHKKNEIAKALDPARTHLNRQRAFWVDIHESGKAWQMPWVVFNSSKSEQEILQAEQAYSDRHQQLEALKAAIYAAGDIELANSLHLPPDIDL